MDNLQALAWHTEQRVVQDLIPFEYNPRKLTEDRKANRRIIQYYNDNQLQFEVYLNDKKMNQKAIDKIMNNVKATKS